MPSIGIGLIGLGRHGLRYARHLLQDIAQAKLVAVCRRTVERGHGLDTGHEVRCYGDYRQLVTDPEVDAVVVVTPPTLARSICLEAVQAKKPILIEKPLAATGAEARTIVQTAARAGVPLMTAQTLRFDPTVLALRARLPTVGRRRYLTLTTRIERSAQSGKDPHDYGGRGVLLEVGVHLLDLVRFLTGEEVQDVRCELADSSGLGVETRAFVTLRTAGGLSCVIDVSRESPVRTSRAEWIGEDGQLTADWFHHRLVVHAADGACAVHDLEPRPTIVAVLRAFLDALIRGTPMPVSGEDGQRAVEIADACYESAASGTTVALPVVNAG
jgi:predicted dehydrogenase